MDRVAAAGAPGQGRTVHEFGSPHGGSWERPLPGRLRESTWDLDAEIRAELAVWRSTSRRRDVRLSVAGALLALVGYAATGSPATLLLLLGVILAAAAVRDLRWPAVGLLLLGLGARGARLTLLPLGVLTLSVQDVLLLAGVGLRGGVLGMVRRGVVILVIGGIGLTIALSGSVG